MLIFGVLFIFFIPINFQYVQRSITQPSYREPLLVARNPEVNFIVNLVCKLLNLIIVFTVCFANEDVNKTSTI